MEVGKEEFMLQTFKVHLKSLNISKKDMQQPSSEFLQKFFGAFVEYLNELVNELAISDDYQLDMLRSCETAGGNKSYFTYQVMKHLLHQLGLKYFKLHEMYQPTKHTKTTLQACASYLRVVGKGKELPLRDRDITVGTMKELNDIKNEVQRLAQMKIRHTQSKGKLLHNLQTYNEQEESLNNEIENLKKEESEKELQNLRGRIKKLKTEINYLDEKIKHTMETIANLCAKVVEEDEMQIFMEKKQELSSEIEDLNREIVDLESADKAKKALLLHLKSLQQELLSISHEDYKVFCELQELRREAVKLGSESEQMMKKHIKEEREEIKSSKRKITESKEQRENKSKLFQHIIGETAKKRDNLRMLNVAVNQRYQEVLRAIKAKDAEVEEVQSQISAFQQNLQNNYAKILISEKELMESVILCLD